MLRQQTASVSSQSSTSTGVYERTDHGPNNLISGPQNYPISSRRHRSSSNLSTRSMNLAGSSNISGIAPAREPVSTPWYARDHQTSRRNSNTSTRRSEATSPFLTSSFHGDSLLHASSHPSSVSQYPSGSSNPSTMAASTRLEEVTYHRAELERVKRENGILRQRIQELEKALSGSLIGPNSTSTSETHPHVTDS